jgi:hypothetical protein
MIIFGIINAPGMVHDSTMASCFSVCEKLQKEFDETGFCILHEQIQIHHQVIRGLSFQWHAINGNQLSSSVNVTSSWMGNSSPIRFIS